MEPTKWPEPRDIRSQLYGLMANKYKGKQVSDITFSTEFILKSIKPKDGPERPILKYKVINIDWEDTRELKDVAFDRKMFRWEKGDSGINDRDYGADY
jgi:hypothetical protein